MDIFGKVLFTGFNTKEAKINLEGTAKGLYLFQLKVEGKLITKKIIVD